MSQEFVVAPEDAGVRIDRYLSDQCQDISRSYLQKLLKEESVLVEEKPVKSNYKVNTGDRISLTLPEIREPEIVPEDIPLDIIYEDKDIILINKPKGMVVHPAAGHYSGTLVNGLMSHCRSELSGINGVMRLGSSIELTWIPPGFLLYVKMIWLTILFPSS
nr:RluA family pseudouridine synthase [Lacrimispora celerecrescens]